jgi:hypothetical protein
VGGLIPTGNDLEIIAKLNIRFSNPGLAVLRAWEVDRGESLFAAGGLYPRTLERVSVRLGIYPNMLGGRGRWLYFLANILKPASGGVTYTYIQNILAQAVANPPAVDSVVFNVLEDSTGIAADYYLYPTNAANWPNPQVSPERPPPPSGLPVYLITLVCPQAIPAGVPGYEPPPDGHEPPNQIITGP